MHDAAPRRRQGSVRLLDASRFIGVRRRVAPPPPPIEIWVDHLGVIMVVPPDSGYRHCRRPTTLRMSCIDAGMAAFGEREGLTGDELAARQAEAACRTGAFLWTGNVCMAERSAASAVGWRIPDSGERRHRSMRMAVAGACHQRSLWRPAQDALRSMRPGDPCRPHDGCSDLSAAGMRRNSMFAHVGVADRRSNTSPVVEKNHPGSCSKHLFSPK